jgi:hypothetical protein
VADRQYHHLLSVIVIEGDVSSMTEFNYPLAELRWHFFDGTANLWMLAEFFDALSDRLDGTPSRISALGKQKIIEAGHIEERGLGPP